MPHYLSLSVLTIIPNTTFMNTFHLCSSPNTRDQLSHPYIATGLIMLSFDVFKGHVTKGMVFWVLPLCSVRCLFWKYKAYATSIFWATNLVHLWAPCVLYIGQTYRYSPQYSFYIFSQQIYLIIFLDFLSPSSFIPPKNVRYLLMLPFLVYKIFTLYINGVLNCKYPAPGPKG